MAAKKKTQNPARTAPKRTGKGKGNGKGKKIPDADVPLDDSPLHVPKSYEMAHARRVHLFPRLE